MCKFKRCLILFSGLLIFNGFLFAQNVENTKKRIEILASEEFGGRGYVGNSADTSSAYIAGELKKAGVLTFGDSYFQDFNYPVNTFPGKLVVKADGKKLTPGSEYLIGPATPSIKGKYEVWLPDSLLLNDTIKFVAELTRNDFRKKVFVLDYAQTQNIEIKKFYIKIMQNNRWFGCVAELISDELMWSVSTRVQKYPTIKIKREAYNRKTKKICVDVESVFVKKFNARNVIGYIPGETDDFIVFSAHYDHLGRMGKDVFIPGAQDNASGTALLLDLADYYSKNKPKHSIAFMFFFGEEAGLLGSLYYVLNPMFDLTKIKAVINIDLAGTGDDGITIVNGSSPEYEKEWQLFEKINAENSYFKVMKPRDISMNSDHYPFHEMGVKAVFIYTMGGKTYYHNPKDKPETLTFGGYNQLFGLVTKFAEEYE